VLVTHDRAVADRADRILLLDDGRVTAASHVAAGDAGPPPPA
jgi:ABC-type lipoprotein export system ATPase subunit